MTVMDVAGHPGRTRSPVGARPGRLPSALSRCQRVVALTVRLPEFLLAAAGTAQRLDAAGVSVDLLELAWLSSTAERAAVAALDRLELRALSRHRLAMLAPFGVERTGDVVAAMSELIGFDPEPGVLCLVPGPGDGHRAAYQAVDATAALIADAYRMRILRYAPAVGARTAEVELEPDEWRRKCDSLAACAPDVAPLSGRREFFAT
ncbi:MAG: hypothetical protein DLM61_04830 [Pseudonocardiales bacterium]|nr:MAG: hypothetical protein DLM61_04830 [Pseudonocardiales bacterium]